MRATVNKAMALGMGTLGAGAMAVLGPDMAAGGAREDPLPLA